jgi:ankyrin repeat protein
MLADEDSTRLLQAYGADVNAQDSAGDTALILEFVSRPNPERVRFLLEHGAIVSLKDNEHKTALDYAKKSAGRDLIRLLEEASRRERSP